MIRESLRSEEVPAQAATVVTDAEFDGFCNELTALSEAALSLGLPDSASQTVEEVRKSALAQHFRIVLVSPFQGGKSTIFNTICGGRELSPTGYGIKTSAAIAEARYLEDPDQEEHAEMEWRTDEELLAGMQDLVFPQLLRPERPGSREARKDPASIRLSHPEDRLLLLAAVRDSFKSPDLQNQAESFDVLKVAWLTLEHYAAAESFRRESRVPLARATAWLSFPADWATRSLSEFQPDEMAFLFLKKAVFHLHEPGLRKLRAAITDAPGLQASRWDTAITTDCIRQAHAVIFLLGTQARALAQAELSEFESFRRFDLADSVFYGYNARSRSRHLVRERLLPNDLAQLRNVGFEIPEDRISVFNALLAYRSRQYQLLSEGRLPTDTVHALSAKALEVIDPSELPQRGGSPIENARYLIAYEIEGTYRDFTGKKLAELSPEGVREAGEESNWEDLIARATQFVIARKGEAILLDRGARQLIKVVERLDGDLQDREKAAERDAGTMQKERENAEAALLAFEEEVKKLRARVEEEIENQGRRLLLDELRGRLDKGALEAAMNRVIEGTESPRFLPTRLAGEATDFVEKAIGGWQANLTSGSSRALGRIAAEIIKPVELRLEELARQAESKAPGLLSGGAMVLASKSAQVAHGDIGDIVRGMYAKSSWSEFADTAEDVMEEIGLGGVVSWFRGFFNRQVIDSQAIWKSRVPTTVRAVRHAAGELAAEVVEGQVAGMRKEVGAEMSKAVQEVREAYQARLRQREADLAKSFEEKKRIAREAAERRHLVGRFRKQVDDFVGRVLSRLGKSA